MKKTVLTFGLISGVILSVLMGGSLLLSQRIGSGHSLALGYTIMVASFLLIYFGIRSYRDNILAGQISFGRAFSCGLLITLITTVCYVAAWEVLYFNFVPHFMDSYFAAQIGKVQTSGFDPTTTAAKVAAIERSQQLYQNPLVNMAHRPPHHSDLRRPPPPQSSRQIHSHSRSHNSISRNTQHKSRVHPNSTHGRSYCREGPE